MDHQFPAQKEVFHQKTRYSPRKSWQTLLIGRPLSSGDAPHQTIGKLVGLAVFASDALSSTAYATQEILGILAAAGSGALGYVFPISIAIVALIIVVVTSYEQTIHAYPNGGGAYVVALENLGHIPAQVAGAALLFGYVLTVSVSISSGVAQIISAAPGLFAYRVELSLILVAFMIVVNLRGVRESGTAFAIPAYVFLAAMILTIGVGLVRAFTGTLGTVTNPPEMYTPYATLQLITPFLLLHAFSSGTSALTGIEAIANGVTAFKPPSSRNAGIVLVWMGAILSMLFLGISYLARATGAVPSEAETVISQMARTIYGGEGFLYVMVVAMTSLILILAANTAFAGFPRLAAILAEDGYLPRQFTYRGSRLVFSKGIIALGVFAGLLIILFDASVPRLIPLYAIGVFLSFTLSQIGMARRWWKIGRLDPGQVVSGGHGAEMRHDSNYMVKLVVNALGAAATGVVTLVFGVTNFTAGAWIVVLLVPILVVIFSGIRRHYLSLARRLSLEQYASHHPVNRYRVILPISGVHQGSLAGLYFARSLSADVTAVYVSMDPEDAEKLKAKWGIYGEGVRLLILESPFRLLLEPILEYIESVCQICQSNEMILVVVPQFVSRKWWTGILHNQTAFMLRLGLLTRPGVVIIEVPYQVD